MVVLLLYYMHTLGMKHVETVERERESAMCQTECAGRIHDPRVPSWARVGRILVESGSVAVRIHHWLEACSALHLHLLNHNFVATAG